MNKILISGNVTKEPEFAATRNGEMYARFNVANNDRGKDESADFFTFSAFKKTAELCEKYMYKGQKVLIEGSVHNNNYKGKDGAMVYQNSFVVNRVEFLSWRDKQAASKPDAFDDDSDLPY